MRAVAGLQLIRPFVLIMILLLAFLCRLLSRHEKWNYNGHKSALIDRDVKENERQWEGESLWRAHSTLQWVNISNYTYIVLVYKNSFRFSHLMSLNQSPFFYLHNVLGLGHFLCTKSQIPLSTYAFSKGLCSRRSKTTEQLVGKVVLNTLVWKHMDHRQIECASVCDTPSSEWLHFVLDPYLSLNWIVLPICTQATLFQYY